jgi:hypothetical protein
VKTPKAIICVGFGKCGTTSLHQAFVETPEAIVPSVKKELKYFTGESGSLKDYLAHFHDSPDEIDYDGSVLFEASPPYATGPSRKKFRNTLKKIKELLPDAIIVLNMRNPVKRSYSHYLHNLQSFSVFGTSTYALHKRNRERNLFSNPFTKSFVASLYAYPNLKPSYSETIQIILNVFGRDQFVPFFMEQDIKQFSGFMARLSDKIGIDIHKRWQGKSAPKMLEGKGFPVYFYATQKQEIACGDQSITLETGEFLAASAKRKFIVQNVPTDIGKQIELTQSTWTRGLPSNTATSVLESFFRRDVEKSSRVLKKHGFSPDILASYLDPIPDYKFDIQHRSILDDLNPGSVGKVPMEPLREHRIGD